MDDDDFSIFYGFGSMHDLRDAPHTPSPLAGLRSVKNHTTLSKEPKDKARPIGFHRPPRLVK
jgi:hypothetical protein